MMKRYAEISTVVQVRPATVLLPFRIILPQKQGGKSMKIMFKRILSVLLVAVMIVGSAPLSS